MYLIPAIRTSRAIAACTLFPLHPIEAVAASESISLVLPFVNNSYMATDIFIFMFYFFNDNEQSLQLIEQFKQKDILYYQSEMCCLLLYLLSYFTKNYLTNIM